MLNSTLSAIVLSTQVALLQSVIEVAGLFLGVIASRKVKVAKPKSLRRDMGKASRKAQRSTKRYSKAPGALTAEVKAANKLARAARAVRKTEAKRLRAQAILAKKPILKGQKPVEHKVTLPKPVLKMQAPVSLALVRPTNRSVAKRPSVYKPKAPAYAVQGAFGTYMARAMNRVAGSTSSYEADWASTMMPTSASVPAPNVEVITGWTDPVVETCVNAQPQLVNRVLNNKTNPFSEAQKASFAKQQPSAYILATCVLALIRDMRTKEVDLNFSSTYGDLKQRPVLSWLTQGLFRIHAAKWGALKEIYYYLSKGDWGSIYMRDISIQDIQDLLFDLEYRKNISTIADLDAWILSGSVYTDIEEQESEAPAELALIMSLEEVAESKELSNSLHIKQADDTNTEAEAISSTSGSLEPAVTVPLPVKSTTRPDQDVVKSLESADSFEAELPDLVEDTPMLPDVMTADYIANMRYKMQGLEHKAAREYAAGREAESMFLGYERNELKAEFAEIEAAYPELVEKTANMLASADHGIPKPFKLTDSEFEHIHKTLAEGAIKGFSGFFSAGFNYVRQDVLKANPATCFRDHQLAKTFTYLIGYMRQNTPITLPPEVKVGEWGYVPESFRNNAGEFPGADLIHSVVSQQLLVNGKTQQLVETFENGRKEGDILVYTGLDGKTKHLNPTKAKKVREILVEQERFGGVIEGFSAKDARTLAPYVSAVSNLLYLPGVNIYVPAFAVPAIKLYCKYGGKKGTKLNVTSKIVGISDTWHQPMQNLNYSDVKTAFQFLTEVQYRKLNNANSKFTENEGYGNMPITYIETAEGFDVYLAGGSKFTVLENAGGVPAVYFTPDSTVGSLRLRSLIVGAPSGDVEYGKAQVRVLNPLDVMWYCWENYGFAAMNRVYTDNTSLNKNATNGATEFKKFVRDFVHSQYEEEISAGTRSTRELKEAQTYTNTSLALNVPLNATLVLTQDEAGNIGYVHVPSPFGMFDANKSKTADKTSNISQYYSALRSKFALQHDRRVNVNSFINVSNRWLGLANDPKASCEDFIGHEIAAARYDGLSFETAKRIICATWAANWQDWGHEAKLGALDFLSTEEVENLVLQAILGTKQLKQHLAELRTVTNEFSSNDAAWSFIAKNLIILHSNKTAKAMKRATMNFALVCDLKHNQDSGWVYYSYQEDHKSVSQLVSAALAVNLPTLPPGMGELRKDAIKAYYPVGFNGADIKLPANTNSSVRFVLLPELQNSARMMRNASRGICGWKFAKNSVLVQRDQVVGHVYVGESELPLAEVKSSTKGMLNRISWKLGTDLGSDSSFTVALNVTADVVDSLKLRDGVKLNSLACDMHSSLGNKPNGNNSKPLNGAGFSKSVDLFIAADCYKGADNFAYFLRVLGANYTTHGKVVPEMFDLLVRTNNKVETLMGAEPTNKSDALLVEPLAFGAGVYTEMLEDCDARFLRPIWHYQRTPNADMTRVLASQTRNRAVATADFLESRVDPNQNGAGKTEPWRFVSSEELATITGKDGAKLDNRLINAVIDLEKAGVYKADVAPAEQAFVVTNAVGDITPQDTIVCSWMQGEKGNNPHYQILCRGYGYARNNDLDFLYPVQVEYTTIPQSVTSTSLMPFAIIDNSISGNKELALSMCDKVAENMELDRMLGSFVKPKTENFEFKQFTINGVGCPLIKLDLNDKPEDYFNEEQLELLRNPDSYLDSVEFLTQLSNMSGDVIWVLRGEHGDCYTAHLATILKWGKASLYTTGQSAASHLVDFFKNWLVHGCSLADQHSAKSVSQYGRMLGAYLSGRNHTKSLLRGEATVYMKAAASCLVPSGEVWVHKDNMRHFCKVYGVSAEEITHVGFRRMPMFRSNVSKIRFLDAAEIGRLRREYGVTFSPGRVYLGFAQMYSNFGDLDGDAIELNNLSYAVANGLCKVDDFESIVDLLQTVLGLDLFDPAYWNSGAVDQYIADHHNFKSFASWQKKTKVSLAKNVLTLSGFAEKQKAAASVQMVTVGMTYKVSVVHAMLAEVMPVAEQYIRDCGESNWIQSFSNYFNGNGRTQVYKLLQMYEVALGGYDPAMAKVTLGYMCRAMNAETDTTHWSLLNELKEDLQARASRLTGAHSVMDNYPGDVLFNHIDEAKVKDALVELGFSKSDFATFRDCFIVTGMAKRIGRMGDSEWVMLPTTMQLILTMVESVVNVSQDKLNVDGIPDAMVRFHEVWSGMKNAFEAEYMSDKDMHICTMMQDLFTNTATGKIFKSYYDSKVMEFDGNIAFTSSFADYEETEEVDEIAEASETLALVGAC